MQHQPPLPHPGQQDVSGRDTLRRRLQLDLGPGEDGGEHADTVSTHASPVTCSEEIKEQLFVEAGVHC